MIWFLWRASLPWGLLRSGAELARLLVDTVAPPAIAREPGMLRPFNVTGGWGEVIFLPVMVLPIVVSAAVLGGMVEKAVRGFGRPADRPST